METTNKRRVEMSSFGSRAVSVQPAGGKQWVSVQRQLVPEAKDPGGLRRQQNVQENGFLRTLDGDLILSFQEGSEGEAAARELQGVERIEVRSYGVKTLDEEAILSCVRLRICNLSECYISDITPFYGSVNLLKLDLSDNQVGFLARQCVGGGDGSMRAGVTAAGRSILAVPLVVESSLSGRQRHERQGELDQVEQLS